MRIYIGIKMIEFWKTSHITFAIMIRKYYFLLTLVSLLVQCVFISHAGTR